MEKSSRGGLLLKLCGIRKQQEQPVQEEAKSSFNGACQLQVKADHAGLLRVEPVHLCFGRAQAQGRQVSIKHLLLSLNCGRHKQKRHRDIAKGETDNKEALQKQLEADHRGFARILVLGRSGAGKSTLIRVLVGNDGPQSISEGVAGVQDINKEFVYTCKEHGVSLIIHDSNGMDVKGKERVNEIMAFLDEHQKCDDRMQHIHVIWYVISAIDPRFVDDGDVMKLLRKYKIPLLLIMTHEDYDKVKVTEASLNRLLQAYGEVEEREAMKRLMVRISNEGVCIGANDEVIVDDLKRDMDGLRLVVERTKFLVKRMLVHS